MSSATLTLSKYIGRRYLLNFLLLLAGLMAVIYLFDTVELIRRASKRDDIPFTLVLQMGLLKLPEVLQIIFPFAVLFSAMFTFWQLTRRSELVVMRSSGFSVWQFLAPVIMIAFFAGVIQVTVLNPVSAIFLGKFEQLENVYLKRSDNQIAVFEEGLWLRQKTDDNQYIILHAAKINQSIDNLSRVTVYEFADDNSFQGRLDASKAVLEQGQWVFEDVISMTKDGETITFDRFTLPTALTASEITDSFGSPETMSFWRLPSHIETLQETGFDPTRLMVHYQNLLSQPLLMISMVLLAASVSMRPPRFSGTVGLVAIGIFLGFALFFMSSFLQALGVSRQIPVFLAAWSPAMISLLLGATMIMVQEDG